MVIKPTTIRIYAGGTSGGARMASGLYFLRDDFFKGIISNVGFETADRLPDDDFDAEFDDPDHLSMYEYGIVRWVGEDAKTTGRTAQQTYYNSWGDFTQEGDFREMENLSIYHLSMIANGNGSKLVNSPGTHSTRYDYAFEEAVKWMVHPLIPVVEDEFDNAGITSNAGVGNGFSVIFNPVNVSETSVSGVATGSVDGVQLEADTEIRSKDVFDWNDDYGMRLVTAMRSDFGDDYNQRMEVSLVPADVREGAAFRLMIEQTDRTTKTAKLVLVESNGTPLTLCSFSFMADDEPMDRAADDRAYFLNDDFRHPSSYEAPGYNFRGLNIYWFMDDDKFQINFRQNIDRSTFSSDLAVPPVLTRLSLFAGKTAFFLRFQLKGLHYIFSSALRVGVAADPAGSG